MNTLTPQQLIAFVEAEQKFTRKEWEQRRTREVQEQVLSGDLITSLTLLQQHGRELTLSAPINESKFREGDSLLLRDEANTVQCPVRFMEDHRTSQQLKVRLIGDDPLPPQPWCLETSLFDLSPLLLRAIQSLYSPSSQSAFAILFGSAEPEIDEFLERDYRQAAPTHLNDSQKKAFAQALSCVHYATIQGPPGTGKTAVIAAIVHQAVQQGLRVLITSHTHKAVNNALMAIQKGEPRFAVLKYGHEDHATELPETIVRVPMVRAGDDPLPEPGVMGAVLVAAHGLADKIGAFDLVLCDEASQVTLPLAACALASGRRWVFVGDQRQLPPIVRSVTRQQEPGSGEATDTCAKSIFEFLQERGGGVMLDETYRLNRKITAWTSREFYSGQLRANPRAAMRKLRVEPPYHPLLSPDEGLVLALVPHTGATDQSLTEATLTATLIQELYVRHNYPLHELGVTSPFRAQNRLIRGLIEAQLGGPLERDEHSLLIDTVDRAQGQEREVMIVSLTSSERAYASTLASFILSPERLNVAITRAKTKSIVLFSPQFLEVRAATTNDLPLLNRLHQMVRELPTYQVDIAENGSMSVAPYLPPHFSLTQ